MRGHRLPVWAVLGAAIALAAPRDAPAYAFGVSPIRVDLDDVVRTGAITVANDDQVPVSFQMRLMRWTQDGKGADQLEESKDLIHFPHLMTIEPAQTRIIRIGTKAATGAVESTYRLFIEEMGVKAGAPGTAVAVRKRFAVPIFVAPRQPSVRAELLNVASDREQVRFEVRNTGNRHLKFESLSLRRGNTPVKEIAGWYVLAGATRAFSIPLPAGECARRGALTLVAKSEQLELKRELTLDAASCGP